MDAASAGRFRKRLYGEPVGRAVRPEELVGAQVIDAYAVDSMEVGARLVRQENYSAHQCCNRQRQCGRHGNALPGHLPISSAEGPRQ